MENDKYPEPLVFGLDIGTRSIVGTVGYREHNNFFVVAQCIHEHETRAMMDGQIHDIIKVSETIREVKEELEAQLEMNLTEVCIAAAGRVLKTVKVSVEYEFHGETTVNEDYIRSLDLMGVEKAYSTLRDELQENKKNFYCIGYSVINYTLNGYSMIKLNGHKAKKIGTELLATFLPDEVINGLYTAVEAANLQVASLTLEPIAAISIAIPENFRLLNIAMVDVGAGTSDISITKDGSIIAYGMIPEAGDEITEAIAKKYLVEFKVAEDMKTACLKKKKVSFKDIMGTTQKISTEEIMEAVSGTLQKITKGIAEKIIELNGGKSVSAVFVVGGGGKFSGFISSLAQYLNLPIERVALRGEDVLKSVTFLQDNMRKDSLMVTPIGICMHYYEQSNNFIFVTVNGERIKLYDNNKLTISDAAIQLGYSNEKLFPQRGKPINYTLNGEPRIMKGGLGEAALISLNGETVGLTQSINHNDIIEIVESTVGKDASSEIRQLPQYRKQINFSVNGKKVLCPNLVMVNGKLVSEYYRVQENDDINILNYYTIKQLMEFMDIDFNGEILINNIPADMEDKVFADAIVQFNLKNTQTITMSDTVFTKSDLANNNYDSGNNFISTDHDTSKPSNNDTYSVDNKLDSNTNNLYTEFDTAYTHSSNSYTESNPFDSDINNSGIGSNVNKHDNLDENIDEANNANKTEANLPQDIYITINAKVVKLSNKSKYIYVDIFDFYPFDLSTMKGTELVTLLNGERVDFTVPLKDKDNVEIFWRN